MRRISSLTANLLASQGLCSMKNVRVSMYCFSTATIVTRTRQNVTLHVHCFALFPVVLWCSSFLIFPQFVLFTVLKVLPELPIQCTICLRQDTGVPLLPLIGCASSFIGKLSLCLKLFDLVGTQAL